MYTKFPGDADGGETHGMKDLKTAGSGGGGGGGGSSSKDATYGACETAAAAAATGQPKPSASESAEEKHVANNPFAKVKQIYSNTVLLKLLC